VCWNFYYIYFGLRLLCKEGEKKSSDSGNRHKDDRQILANRDQVFKAINCETKLAHDYDIAFVRILQIEELMTAGKFCSDKTAMASVYIHDSTRENGISSSSRSRSRSGVTCKLNGSDSSGALEGETTCIVCMDRPADAVLLECGHSRLCVKCATVLWDQARRCLLCRRGFAAVMRIVARETSSESVRALGSREPRTPAQLEKIARVRAALRGVPAAPDS
jgi:hypothetical protein